MRSIRQGLKIVTEVAKATKDVKTSPTSPKLNKFDLYKRNASLLESDTSDHSTKHSTDSKSDTTTHQGKTDKSGDTSSSNMDSAVDYGTKAAMKLSQETHAKYNHSQPFGGLPSFSGDSSILKQTKQFETFKRDYSTKVKLSDQSNSLSKFTSPYYRFHFNYQLTEMNVNRLSWAQVEHYQKLSSLKNEAPRETGHDFSFQDKIPHLAKIAEKMTMGAKVCVPVDSLHQLGQILQNNSFEICKNASEEVKKLFPGSEAGFDPVDFVQGYLSTNDDGSFESQSWILDGKLMIGSYALTIRANNEQYDNFNDIDDPGATSDHSSLGHNEFKNDSILNEPNHTADITIMFKEDVREDTTMTFGKPEDCEKNRNGPVPVNEPNEHFFVLDPALSPWVLQNLADSPTKIRAQIHKKDLSLKDIEKIVIRNGGGGTPEDLSRVSKLLEQHKIPIITNETKKAFSSKEEIERISEFEL